MADLHIYTAPLLDAHDFLDGTFDPPIHVTTDPATMLFCEKCDECWPARQMVVQCFYDGRRYWCKEGFGCKDRDRREAHRERTRRRRSAGQRARWAEARAKKEAGHG